VDQSPATAGSYGVQSIPTIIIFKKGAIVDEFVGLMQLNPLRQRFERHALPPTKETT
jgi:thioredoxin-like negative regulator of GroEL